jgi:hypothetical protein
MAEVLEHGFDPKRCPGVRILEAKQINSDDSAIGIETNILAKESGGLDTGYAGMPSVLTSKEVMKRGEKWPISASLRASRGV